jgi:hypothetical protein
MIHLFVLLVSVLPFAVGLYALARFHRDQDDGSDDQPPPPDPKPPLPNLPPSPEPRRPKARLRRAQRPPVAHGQLQHAGQRRRVRR